MGKTTQLGELEAVDTYEEKYLLAYAVNGGRIFSKTIGIPVYLDVTVAVAEQLIEKPKPEVYEKWIDDVRAITAQFQSDSVKMCKEIIIFNEAPPSGDYEYVNPSFLVGVLNPTESNGNKAIKSQNDSGEYQNARSQNVYSSFDKRPKGATIQAKSSKVIRSDLGFPLPAFPRSPLSSPSGSESTERRTQLKPCGSVPVPRTDVPDKKKTDEGTVRREVPGKAVSKKPPAPPPSGVQKPSPCVTLNPTSSPSRGYRTLGEVPIDVDIRAMTVEEVAEVLRLMNLGGHCAAFERKQVDGELLTQLSEEMLVEELGISKLDAKRLTMFANEGWRPKSK